jgi:hypothetical protein
MINSCTAENQLSLCPPYKVNYLGVAFSVICGALKNSCLVVIFGYRRCPSLIKITLLYQFSISMEYLIVAKNFIKIVFTLTLRVKRCNSFGIRLC